MLSRKQAGYILAIFALIFVLCVSIIGQSEKSKDEKTAEQITSLQNKNSSLKSEKVQLQKDLQKTKKEVEAWKNTAGTFCQRWQDSEALILKNQRDRLEKVKQDLDEAERGIHGKRSEKTSNPTRFLQAFTGEASHYGEEHRGKPTASGEPFNPDDLTAAHRALPFGTRVRVKNAKTGATVTVRCNDRGPYVQGRVIDLSEAAFAAIAPLNDGTADVICEVL